MAAEEPPKGQEPVAMATVISYILAAASTYGGLAIMDPVISPLIVGLAILLTVIYGLIQRSKATPYSGKVKEFIDNGKQVLDDAAVIATKVQPQDIQLAKDRLAGIEQTLSSLTPVLHQVLDSVNKQRKRNADGTYAAAPAKKDAKPTNWSAFDDPA